MGAMVGTWTRESYREYIASPEWQRRRGDYLWKHPWCAKCGVARMVARPFYGQDLHVHHLSYAHIGQEWEVDLQALCLACHEVETFGHTFANRMPPEGNRIGFWLAALERYFGGQWSLVEERYVGMGLRGLSVEELDRGGVMVIAGCERYPGANAVVEIFWSVRRSWATQ